MTKLLATAIALSLAGTTPAFAVDAHHPDAQEPTPSRADQPASAATASQLLENAKRLQEEAQDIAGANAGTERERLLQQHVKTLRSSMMLSSGMMSGNTGQSAMTKGSRGSAGMMGGGMGPGMMGGHMGPGMMGGHMGPDIMTMMMVMIDTNGDGTLSLEEVQAVHARMFNYADSDKDGKLSKEELQGFLRGGFDSDDD